MIFRPKNKLLAITVQVAEFGLLAFDWMFFLFFRHSLAQKRHKKILIVRLDAIGDFVIWLAAAKEIRQLYPGYQVILLGNDLWTDLAKGLPFFDAVWPLNRKRFLMNPLYRFRMLKRVQHDGFQIALHPVFSRDFFVGDACVRASRAPTRIGFFGNNENITLWQKRIGDTWYTKLIASYAKHQLEQDADFVRALGTQYQASLPQLPRFPLPKDFILKDYYVVIPGAGHEMRQWPLDNFQEIARRIYNKTGLTAVLCGGKREVNLSQAFQKGLDVPTLDMVGHTSLLELVSIIAHAKFVVGNDTGAIHIAVATATPSVCILGGAHPGRYIPYPPELNAAVKPVVHSMGCFNCDWNCTSNKPGVVPCINNISVDDVWEVLLSIL